MSGETLGRQEAQEIQPTRTHDGARWLCVLAAVATGIGFISLVLEVLGGASVAVVGFVGLLATPIGFILAVAALTVGQNGRLGNLRPLAWTLIGVNLLVLALVVLGAYILSTMWEGG
jgi:hypothetical protein